VQGTVNGAERTQPTVDQRFTATGDRLNDPATAYFNKDGSYVVLNNNTHDVVQVSNRNDPDWIPNLPPPPPSQ